MTRHSTDDDLVLHRYEPDEAVRGHLDSCAACTARARDLEALLDTLETAPVPDRGEGYGRMVWRRLEPRLSRSWRARLTWWTPGSRAPQLARTVALACAITIAFLVGRHSSQPREALPAVVRERILLAAIGEQLDRSERVLLSLQGLPEGDGEELSRERERASRLVESSRLFRQTASHGGDRETARQLEAIERLLLRIAREPAPTTEDRAASASSSDALFRVRVLATHLRERERSLRASAPGNRI